MEPTFGRRLTAWLRHRGIKQAEFARELGISRSTVCEWMSDTSAPRVEKLPTIAAALGLTSSELFGDLPPRRRSAA